MANTSNTNRDNYLVEYQTRENDKFNLWFKQYESTDVLNIIAHLIAVHNNKDSANRRIRVIRITSMGREIVRF